MKYWYTSTKLHGTTSPGSYQDHEQSEQNGFQWGCLYSMCIHLYMYIMLCCTYTVYIYEVCISIKSTFVRTTKKKHYLLKHISYYIYIASFNMSNSTFCPMCIYMFVWITEHMAVISLHSINCLFFVTNCLLCGVNWIFKQN